MLDTPSLERRRAQNRDAQRRFRQRQRSQEDRRSRESALVHQLDNPAPIRDGEPKAGDGFGRPPSGMVSLHDQAVGLSSDRNPLTTVRGAFYCERSGYGSYSLLDNIVTINMGTSPDKETASFPLEDFPGGGGGGHPVQSLSGSRDETCGPSDAGTTGIRTSALHVAAQMGREGIARTLLLNGADCDLGDRLGQTPLMLAAIEGHGDVAGLLLAHGASVRLADHQGRSALHWAVAHRRGDLLAMLLGACSGDRAALDARDDGDDTPLHLAVKDDFEPGVQMLLGAGASMML